MELNVDFHSFREQAVSIRRDLHQHPELGFQETRTAGIVAGFLEQLGLEVRAGVARTGVVGVLRGANPGRTVLLRADMDALPITEATGADYASQTPGVMHACGHDAHTTMALIAAGALSSVVDSLRGQVAFAFQPAEEGDGGAQAMLDDGLLDMVSPDVALAQHVWEQGRAGQAAITPGPVLASCDTLPLLFEGRGGHGAKPHLSDDVIAAASQFVTALQTVVSRSVDPVDTAVVSIGRFHAGSAHNILPARAELSGTVRTYDPEVRAVVLRRIEEIGRGVSEAFGVRFELEVSGSTPPTVNDPAVTEVVRQAASDLLGAENVFSDHRIMASEDMALILKRVPGCYIFLGVAADSDNPVHPVHHPKFDIDEEALLVGAELLATASIGCLEAEEGFELD